MLKEILDARLAFLSLILTGGAAAISRIFIPEEIGWDITAIVWIFSLVFSLFVSALFRSRTKRKKKLIISGILIFLVLISFGIYANRFLSLTCEKEIFSGDSTRVYHYIIGTTPTPDADTFIKYDPRLKDNACDLLDSFANEPHLVWTEKSINKSKKQLSFTYIIFVVFLVACITYLVEVIKPKRKSPNKT